MKNTMETAVKARSGRWRNRLAHLVMAVTLLTVFFMAVILAAPSAQAVLLRDIATFGGVRANQLVGYGLVVGLSGTGDKKNSQFTMQSVANMLDNMGVGVEQGKLQPKNVAAVMVTAQMPVSAKPGTKMDVTLSSLGDATSLLGGVLLMTPLKGIDGKVYALAQGSLILGGFSVAGNAANVQKNISTVGSIPGGAIVERAVPFEFNNQNELMIHMSIQDFSTTMQVVKKINDALGGNYAMARDITTIDLSVPDNFQGNLVPLMAALEQMEIAPESRARVVVDEKTGTIVLGREVRLAKAAIAHGNLQIVVREGADVSQPAPFGQGQTVVTPTTDIGAQEEARQLNMVEGVSLQDLVAGLNAIGVTPRDLIAILHTLKASGSLMADLEVI